MNSRLSPLEEIRIAAKLADLREADYHNTLLIHAMMELLIQKGVCTRDEVLAKAKQLDTELNHQIARTVTNPSGAYPPPKRGNKTRSATTSPIL